MCRCLRKPFFVTHGLIYCCSGLQSASVASRRCMCGSQQDLIHQECLLSPSDLPIMTAGGLIRESPNMMKWITWFCWNVSVGSFLAPELVWSNNSGICFEKLSNKGDVAIAFRLFCCSLPPKLWVISCQDRVRDFPRPLHDEHATLFTV